MRNLLPQDDVFGSVVRGARTALLLQVAGAGLGYVTQVLLARWLGADHYGRYTYVMAWASLLAIPAGLGFGTAVIRFIPQYSSEGDWGLMKGVVRRSWSFTAAAGLTLAAVGTLMILTVDGVWLDIPYAKLMALGMWVVPAKALLDLQLSMGRGLKRMALAYLPNRVLRPIFLIGALAVLLIAGHTLNATSAVLAVGGAYVVAIVIQAVAIRASLPASVRRARPRYETRRWLRVSFPLLLVAAFVLLINRTDVIMLGVLAESRDVGIYNAASRTAAMAGLVLGGVNAIAAPTISSLHTAGKSDQLQELARKVAHLIFWPSLAICLGLIFLAAPILRLFGSEFVGSEPILTILLIGHVVNVGVGSVAYFMNMTGHHDEVARVVGWTALGNIVLNGLAIPQFGAVGAAVATALSMSVWNVWLNRLVLRRIGIRTSIVHAVRRLM